MKIPPSEETPMQAEAPQPVPVVRTVLVAFILAALVASVAYTLQ
jgi:hypothetical protein